MTDKTTTTTIPALLPCPFCGAPDPLVQDHPPHKHAFASMPDHPGSVTVECPACDIGLIKPTRAEAIAAWNRRAAPSVAQWMPIETAPKSLADGSNVRGIYLLGYCPDEGSIDPSSCICVTWWEPNIDGGVWYGEGGYAVRPTHLMPIPAAPGAQPAQGGSVTEAAKRLHPVIREMVEVATSGDDGDPCPEWLASNRATVDRWQCAIRDAFAPLDPYDMAAARASAPDAPEVVEALESLARYAEDMAEKDAQSAAGVGASSTGTVGALSMYIGGQTAAKAIADEARSRAAALRSAGETANG